MRGIAMAKVILATNAVGNWTTWRRTVYVVTAGREATYRIERIYLAQDEAQDFADRYNAMQPVEFLDVESWETVRPPPSTTARTGSLGGRPGCLRLSGQARVGTPHGTGTATSRSSGSGGLEMRSPKSKWCGTKSLACRMSR